MTTPDQSAALATAKELVSGVFNIDIPVRVATLAIARAILLAKSAQARADARFLDERISFHAPNTDGIREHLIKWRDDLRARAAALEQQAKEIAP